MITPSLLPRFSIHRIECLPEHVEAIRKALADEGGAVVLTEPKTDTLVRLTIRWNHGTTMDEIHGAYSEIFLNLVAEALDLCNLTFEPLASDE